MGSRKDFNLFPRQNLQWQRLPMNAENDMRASSFPLLASMQSTFNHILFLTGDVLLSFCVCVETEGCPRRLCKSKNSIERLLCASIYLGTLSNTLRVLHKPNNTSMGYTHFIDEKTRFRD